MVAALLHKTIHRIRVDVPRRRCTTNLTFTTIFLVSERIHLVCHTQMDRLFETRPPILVEEQGDTKIGNLKLQP